jgi:hypothetical protein
MGTFYTMWVARDQNGALRLWDTEPVWGETLWLRRDTGTWLRKLPPRWFPEVKPGEKVRCRLEQLDSRGR